MRVNPRVAMIFALGVMSAAGSRTGGAQYQTRTWLDWRTIETSHFSVHYPTELETWARGVAAKLEGIDSSVSRMVEYSPPRHIAA